MTREVIHARIDQGPYGKAAPRDRGRRAELIRIEAKLRELEVKLDQLHGVLADRTGRLAERVALLERWCPFVQVRDDT
jgi:hypothetical protein